MHTRALYDYAVVRLVPFVDREEFINVGVILSCPKREFLEVCIELDESRLAALYPGADVADMRAHLDVIPCIAVGGEQAGPIGRLSQRERFYWLVAPRSTIVQTSPVHTGFCDDPASALDSLVGKMVRL